MKNRGIAALIWELPEPGAEWPHQAREAWFEYARKTVEVVYGPVILNAARGKISPSISSPSDTPERASGGVTRYQIEPDGTASVRVGTNNRPVDPENIPPDTVLHDYRPQPVDSEYNPIMWKTHGAQKLPLPPGAIVRAATEPWTTPGAANGSAEV
jgi:hypothetical protein